ncbi:MAG: YkgJ family cysteine cluster protein [Bacillota bacterium]|nr:YkgJ family cysteine cluster protein [Bacillota bacterium]
MKPHLYADLQQRLSDGTIPEMGPEDEFRFACRTECMGLCCQNITILLDPWDVETMARHLGLSEREFMDRYCRVRTGSRSPWPVLSLRDAEDGRCAFLLEDGRCRIYPARSRNCRTYPLGRAVRFEFHEGTLETIEKMFLVERMEGCLGHEEGDPWTVREWLDDAGALPYYKLGDEYLRLIHYAATELNAAAWLSGRTLQMLYPLLYGASALRERLGLAVNDVGHEEFYRRRVRALRVILTQMAGALGHGPLAGEVPASGQETMMERVRGMLLDTARCGAGNGE